ncbi:hypothetical protein ASPWEDRAFT_42159 [Aspergillus wentii DTO 134E9]|uniref:Mediator of RNA polymerase II transcription subunit 12 n=1 Tax=Aspergillus wentii DTO 134E9 TaxID=1073089 RepID=A0A1L9RH23_ASPWE|nr:uncharacterized protein ASPWEDRAFT_42159 [Aspergillus wentii DTO 134E9]KAI9927995.1 RNA polymerase II mediator complex subunit [Aspergillus wentii]OJJ34222.1 hypothetical protein ASPWEDRAFT_42159 [Aspergillus wentii DTO 134E9]
MIPHPSAGVHPWGHPLRAVNSGSGRVDVSQGLNQSDFLPEKPSMPVPQPQTRSPAVIDLTTSSQDAQEREPPAKRQRLDVPSGSAIGDASPVPVGGGELKNTAGSASSRPPTVPWRGRPVWSFQALISETPGGGEVHGETTAALAQGEKPASLPPFPTMPWKHTPPDSSGSTRSRESSPVKDVQTTPYRIEVPSNAPALKGDKVADFSPWTGNHPEDVLNEHTAKQGHYDRTQVSQNESNTARPSLYAQLKHRSGLQMLSSVFAAALEKRQNHSMVTNPSTFKPPPRVTLTDNKREAWLRDLANPSVPLRRLSRTIPHGIRGKVLLDQCLSKLIPVGRAVWLAKCVGANEIRAFKRKGTSGALAIGLEAKWVRDWTTNVQQFLEGVLSSCGTTDWRMKVTYAVSLTARLFFEQLLDHDNFLGWFLSSMESARLNTMPVWLLMLGIYWENIMRYRKRGRRLAELLLQKLSQAIKSEQAASLQPLTDRLSLCIKKLVLEHTSSAILPASWGSYKDLVSSCLNLEENVDKTIFQHLAERNARVQPPKNCQLTAQHSPQQRIIYLFDSMRFTHDISSISAACLTSVDDRTALVSKLLEWTATPFRYGLCRVYAGVRLLRKWKMSGVDIDFHILAFLTEARGDAQLNMGNIYHAISELVRSQTFSVGRYLQWLMAKGVTNSPQVDQHTSISGEVGLLAQLPVSRLPEHVRNLRHTLLARAGVSTLEEASIIASVKASISQHLPNIFGVDVHNIVPCDLSQPNLTWAVKYEIGQWIRRGVNEHCRISNRNIPGVDLSADMKVSALTPSEFYHIRDILESFGDLSILADVLKQAANCDDNTVLASAADTLNYHFDSFCIIGATTDLFRRLVEAYARLKRLGTTSLDLVFSLIEVGLQVPNESNTVALLRQDLSRIESKSALAAPSPLSDHIPEIFSESDPLFHEKLNQLLSSGSGIDESTLDTLFNALTRILLSDDQGKLTRNDACRYLAHLRPFYPKHFDAMLIRWICCALKSATRPSLSKILPPLIGVGCVTIQAFVSLVKRLSQSETMGPTIQDIAALQMDILELLIPPSQEQRRYCDLVTYRFHLAQQEFLVKYPEETFGIIHDAAASMSAQNLESESNPRRSDLANYMTILLCDLLTQHPERAAKYCTQKLIDQHPASIVALQKALDFLLGFDTPTDPGSNMSEAERVISMTNDFSLPFCQLKLQVLFNAESGEEIGNGIVDVMFKAAVADSRAKKSNWAGLVSLMSQSAVRQIRERAEKGFFSVPLFENSADDHSSSTADNSSSLETAKLYLTIIEELAYSIPEAGVSSIAPILVEKMDFLLHRLIIMQTNFSNFAENRHGVAADKAIQSRSNFERTLAFWFSALLKMVVIHRSAFNTSPSLAPKPNSLQDQSRLLISIFCISLSRLPDNALRLFPTANYFPHPVQPESYRPCPGILLQTHALDVAASLIDTFPDEARHQCTRFLKEKCPPFLQHQNDSRFLYLLGPVADTTSLNPSQPASAPSPAASGSASTPTPSGNLPGGTSALQQPVAPLSGMSETSNCVASRLRLQCRGRVIGAYPVRPWELLEDAAPIMGANDTAVNLGYFDARRIRA